MKIFPLVLVALGCSGCALYQSSSRIKYDKMEMVLPKDASFDELSVTVPVLFTNGLGVVTTDQIVLTIRNGKFKMNPEVIDRATAHDAAMIRETAAALAAVMASAPK